MKRLVVAMLAAAATLTAPARADVIDDQPAAASRGPGDMVVVARGSDGAIWERHVAGGKWTPWASIGGAAASGPAAVAYGGAVHVFVVGPDGAIWQNHLTGAGWGGWHSLGGAGTSAPSATARYGTPKLDLAVRGIDNAIWHRSFDPATGWSGWASLGGNHASGPSLNSQGTDILNVFSRGGAGQLQQRSWNGTDWFAEWIGLGGGLTAAPATVSRTPGHIDLFVRGNDDALHQRYWTASGSWSAWAQIDPTPLDSAPAVAADTADHLVLFARRGSSILVKQWNGGGWTPWRDWGPVAPPAPPPSPLPDGSVKLTTGVRCTPPGGRLRVSLKVRRRAGRARPRVRRVVFYVKDGPRRVDRRRPYVRRLVLDRPAGSQGRVYARAVYTRKGSKRLRSKTVSKRFVMCG